MRVPLRLGISAVVVACLAVATTACDEPTTAERIADTLHHTEAIRGLTAREMVPYRLLPADEAFDDVFDDWRESDWARKVAADGLVHQRLGLLPPGYDILESTEGSWRTRVGGYYTPATGQLTIISGPDELGPSELVLLSHEYAHALQDQHFDFDAHDSQVEDDAATALEALIEGEASLISQVWNRKRQGFWSPDESETSEISTGSAPIRDIPPLVERAYEFPYVDGSAFVFEHWGDGDWGRIDGLWEAPPVSSEQIMHPERYPDDVPLEVTLPEVATTLGPKWQTASEMVMGEMQIGVLLADGEPWDYGDEVFASPRLKNARAAEGWGGDRLAHLTGPFGQWAIVWQTTWDSAIDAVEFAGSAQDAFEDLPYRSLVSLDDMTGAEVPHPVLVIVTPDAATESRVRDALERV